MSTHVRAACADLLSPIEAAMTLVWPSREYLASYVAALERGWSPNNLRQQQASALAYFDVFWVLAVVMVALGFVVLLMKRSVAGKGARIVPE